MNLFERMRRVQGRHTRGDVKPMYFLLHPSDFDTCKNYIDEERSRDGYTAYVAYTFNGIPIYEWELAVEGAPLVVMGESSVDAWRSRA